MNKKSWKSQVGWGIGLGAGILLVSVFLRMGLWHLFSPAQQSKKTLSLKTNQQAMVLIPAGMFTRGTNPEQEQTVPDALGLMYTPYHDEVPAKTFHLPAYFIDRHEVTINQYKKFCLATKQALPEVWTKKMIAEGNRLPALGVSWEEASAYAAWKGKRLPTEGEWEKAARGPQGSRYVWGNQFDPGFIPSFQNLTTVESNLIDISYYGVKDMAGNVSEWVADTYAPYEKGTHLERLKEKKLHVYKGYHFTEGLGGHYGNSFYFFRAAYRGIGEPNNYYPYVGFRCAKDAISIAK